MSQEQYLWKCQPEAEKIILDFLSLAKNANPYLAFFEKDLLAITSTRILDWVDHIVLTATDSTESALESSGFVSEGAAPNYRVFHHPGAQLPKVVLVEGEEEEQGVAIAVDSIADFLMAQGIHEPIEGSCFSSYRKCLVSTQNNVSLWAIERRGTTSMESIYCEPTYMERYLRAVEQWKTRPRDLLDDDLAMQQTLELAEELVDDLGKDVAAWIVLCVEREFWQSKNTAGQIQKNRQDRMGLGWANHDHHTFRSSRKHFYQLVRLFEILGFHCRERFYAGEEAGWGAQVMENSHCGLVLFLDVDLHPNEVAIDFAHHPLQEGDSLGTIGLWCALHGDSILGAGMHHLEAQFLFEELTSDLAHRGIGMMDPFSHFPYLKQAFTAGEVWSVDPQRIQKLRDKQLISSEDAEKFLKYGAVGSHLENLQRNEGFKGFNQKNVSYIIKKTDPRTLES